MSPRSRRGCFAQWPAARIGDYLQHHGQQNTIAVIWEDNRVLAVGTGAQCDMEDTGNPYLPDRLEGKCLFLETLIVEGPDCFLGLVEVMLKRWPHWRSLQIIGRREGRIVKYDQRVIDKFSGYGWRHLEALRRGRGPSRLRVSQPMPIGL